MKITTAKIQPSKVGGGGGGAGGIGYSVDVSQPPLGGRSQIAFYDRREPRPHFFDKILDSATANKVNTWSSDDVAKLLPKDGQNGGSMINFCSQNPYMKFGCQQPQWTLNSQCI